MTERDFLQLRLKLLFQRVTKFKCTFFCKFSSKLQTVQMCFYWFKPLCGPEHILTIFGQVNHERSLRGQIFMFVWICRGYECLHTGNSGEIFSIMAVVRSRECLTIMLGIQAEEFYRKLRLVEFKIFLLRGPPIKKRNVKNNFSSHFQCQLVKNETVEFSLSWKKWADSVFAGGVCEHGLTSWNTSSLCCPSGAFALNTLLTGSSFSGRLFITYRVLTLSMLWDDCESSCFSWTTVENVTILLVEAKSWLIEIWLPALLYLFLQSQVASNFNLVRRVTLTRSFAGSKLNIDIYLREGREWTTFSVQGMTFAKLWKLMSNPSAYFHQCSTKCIFEWKRVVSHRKS